MFHNLLGTEETERYTEECLRVAEHAPQAGGIRLLWMHTNPFWVEPLRQLTDFNPKVQVVGCDMSFEGFVDADPTKPSSTAHLAPPFSPWNYKMTAACRCTRQAVFICSDHPYRIA